MAHKTPQQIKTVTINLAGVIKKHCLLNKTTKDTMFPCVTTVVDEKNQDMLHFIRLATKTNTKMQYMEKGQL